MSESLVPAPVMVRQPLHTPALLAWLRLARVYQKVDRASAEHLRPWGLTVAQFDVLTRVGVAEGLSQGELAARLLVTKGNVTQLLDRLEHAGLVERRQEGRTNRLYLTARGHQLVADVVPSQEEMIVDLFAALSPAEQESLLTTLRRLDHALP